MENQEKKKLLIAHRNDVCAFLYDIIRNRATKPIR